MVHAEKTVKEADFSDGGGQESRGWNSGILGFWEFKNVLRGKHNRSVKNRGEMEMDLPAAPAVESTTQPPAVIEGSEVVQVGMCSVCLPEDSEKLPPVSRVVLPADVAEFTDSDENVTIIGTREGKVTRIAGLEKMTNLKVSSRPWPCVAVSC